MSEELQQKLRGRLWKVANKLRGNMSASDFMYFILGFIFYKYLLEKIEAYANSALVDDEVSFKELWTMEDEDAAELQVELKKQCLEGVGYFIGLIYLFSSIIDRIKKKENIYILGGAYEYMIGQFAAGAGKKAGEFYTTQEVSQILAEIVFIGHTRLRNVCDPTCGSGSLLLRAAKVGHAVDVYGQEKSLLTSRWNVGHQGFRNQTCRIG